jgi:hypothetical protein
VQFVLPEPATPRLLSKPEIIGGTKPAAYRYRA